MALPALFISHGSPLIALEPSPERDFLLGLGASLPRPRAIVCLSAHWERTDPAVTTTARPDLIYDFHNFPDELYALTYPAPGAPDLAARVRTLLGGAGLACAGDGERGLDHGAWVPLRLIYPEADIPVVQLSIQTARGTRHHLALGRALAPLREDGVLILSSGNATHNLAALRPHGRDPAAPVQPEVSAFEDWLVDAVTEGSTDELLDYRAAAPHGAWNHPTDEHLLPLYAAMGAGAANGEAPAGRPLYRGIAYGVLSMAAFAFDAGTG